MLHRKEEEKRNERCEESFNKICITMDYDSQHREPNEWCKKRLTKSVELKVENTENTKEWLLIRGRTQKMENRAKRSWKPYRNPAQNALRDEPYNPRWKALQNKQWRKNKTSEENGEINSNKALHDRHNNFPTVQTHRNAPQRAIPKGVPKVLEKTVTRYTKKWIYTHRNAREIATEGWTNASRHISQQLQEKELWKNLLNPQQEAQQ